MPASNKPKRYAEAQHELNRQALIDFGKRLADIDKRLALIEEALSRVHGLCDRADEVYEQLTGVAKKLQEKLDGIEADS